MIIDCFPFFNEYDVLECRLQYLDDIVDRFVIVETDVTFSGKSKRYNLIDNISRYKKWQHKIVYLPFSFDVTGHDFSYKPKELDFNAPSWKVEWAQCNHIQRLIEMCNDNDMLLISDVDEIPYKNGIRLAAQLLPEAKIISFEQLLFYYNFQNLVKESWVGSVLTYASEAKKHNPEYFKRIKWYIPKITNGGCHASYFCSPEDIKYKIESFSHQEFNTEENTNVDNIKTKILSNKGPFGEKTIERIENPRSILDPEFYSVFSRFDINNA